jgi:Autotransporter beta-domain
VRALTHISASPLAMLVVAVATAVPAALPSAAWANGCSPGGNAVCPLGETGTGLRANTVVPATQATPLAISGMLSSLVSGSSSGVQRTGLLMDGETGQAAAAGSTRWNAWGALGQNQIGYSFQPLRSSGKINLAMGGVDYTFGNNVILGVAYTGDRTRVDTQFNNGSLGGNGYSVAPYIAVPFGRNWVFDASIGWGRNKISQVDNGTAGFSLTGNTTDARFFSSLAVSYAAQVGKLLWTGKGAYLFSEDKLSQFTQSNNVLVPSTTTRVAQLRLGGQLAYDAGGIVPFAGLTYIYDTQAPTQPVFGGFTPANDRDAWQVALGVNFYSRGPLSGGVQYSQDTSRKEVKNNLLMANIAYRF